MICFNLYRRRSKHITALRSLDLRSSTYQCIDLEPHVRALPLLLCQANCLCTVALCLTTAVALLFDFFDSPSAHCAPILYKPPEWDSSLPERTHFVCTPIPLHLLPPQLSPLPLMWFLLLSTIRTVWGQAFLTQWMFSYLQRWAIVQYLSSFLSLICILACLGNAEETVYQGKARGSSCWKRLRKQ